MKFLKFRRPSEVKVLERMALGEIATGISSQALVVEALGLRSIEHERPYDPGDFGRVMVAYRACPEHIQRKMRWRIDQWRRDLEGKGYTFDHAETSYRSAEKQ